MEEQFCFDEFKPCLDWYEVVHHVINYTDYNYFKLHRRYGPSWWLFGSKYIEEDHSWETEEIGEISDADLVRFIEWSKTKYGNKIIEIHMISCDFDIFKEIKGVYDV